MCASSSSTGNNAFSLCLEILVVLLDFQITLTVCMGLLKGGLSSFQVPTLSIIVCVFFFLVLNRFIT